MTQKITKKDNIMRTDCSYFLGDRPCGFNERCGSCRDFRRIEDKILIIKLESLGDVLRTTPLLAGIRERYPRAHITWLTRREAVPLLENNPFIDRVFAFEFESLIQLMSQDFWQVISLDKSKPACSAANLIKAKIKKGFGLSPHGNIYPFNKNEYVSVVR